MNFTTVETFWLCVRAYVRQDAVKDSGGNDAVSCGITFDEWAANMKGATY